MPLVHLSPYCQPNCPIATSSTAPLMTSYSTPTPSSSSSNNNNTSIDPNNMITHTTISLRKRRMPCQRKRKTHYCYGCEAKVWVHLHSETLVPICHRCLGAFVVALREGSSSASVQAGAPASARHHHHHHHHPLPPTPSTPPATTTSTTTTSLSPNICTQDPYASSHVSLFERLVHCFPIKRTTTTTTTPRPLDYNDVCPICYDTLVSQHEQPVHLAPCMHTFHRACIEQWILGYKTTCPYCCQPTSLSRIQAIDCTMH